MFIRRLFISLHFYWFTGKFYWVIPCRISERGFYRFKHSNELFAYNNPSFYNFECLADYSDY